MLPPDPVWGARLQKQWQTALEVFLVAQMAGVEATPDTCIALLGAFEAAHQSLPAAQLLDSYTQVRHTPACGLQQAEAAPQCISL